VPLASKAWQMAVFRLTAETFILFFPQRRLTMRVVISSYQFEYANQLPFLLCCRVCKREKTYLILRTNHWQNVYSGKKLELMF
jgi:hypothetical protein